MIFWMKGGKGSAWKVSPVVSSVITPVSYTHLVFGPAGVTCIAGNLGGTVRLPFGSAKFIQALHGGGAAGCPACGFLFEMGGKTIYHAGDTALPLDMALLELSLIPI